MILMPIKATKIKMFEMQRNEEALEILSHSFAPQVNSLTSSGPIFGQLGDVRLPAHRR